MLDVSIEGRFVQIIDLQYTILFPGRARGNVWKNQVLRIEVGCSVLPDEIGLLVLYVRGAAHRTNVCFLSFTFEPRVAASPAFDLERPHFLKTCAWNHGCLIAILDCNYIINPLKVI